MTHDRTTVTAPADAAFRLHLGADGTLGLSYASPDLAEVYGVTVDQFAADPQLFHQAVHDVDRPAYERAGRDAAVRQERFRWEGRIVQPDGAQRWVRITARPEQHHDGGTTWSGVVVDRTTQAQRSARELVDMRVHARDTEPDTDTGPDDETGVRGGRGGKVGGPTAILAHDIGTPLTAIAMAADLADQVLDDLAAPTADRDAELRRCLGIVHRNADLLASLRDGLLRGAVEGTDEVVAVPETVRLHQHLVAVAALVGDPARLVVECPPDLVCWVQPSHLDQMLLNLLANADKYAGGAVALRVTTEGTWVTFTVEDDGPGVPSTFRGRLFTPYARGGSTTDQPGSGLGLSIVAELARANAGSVQFEPRPGGGSRFAVTLPLTPSAVGHC